MGRQHQEMDRPGVRQVPKGSGEQGKKEKTGCKIICGAPTTLAVKGLMMMMSLMKGEVFLTSVCIGRDCKSGDPGAGLRKRKGVRGRGGVRIHPQTHPSIPPRLQK